MAAIELLEHLRELTRGTERVRIFSTLQSEIEQDREVLLSLLHELGGKESLVRKTAAWLTEKLGEAKLKLDDEGDGNLRLLEALESLGLGIQGKLGLWRALALARESVPAVRKLDLGELERRAIAQHDRVEAERLRAARAALGA